MMCATIDYYEEILKRLRKGRRPVGEDEARNELEAFDFMYTLSLYYARENGKGADSVWSDDMLLDCGKLSGLIASELVNDADWDELKGIFEPYLVKRIEETGERAEVLAEGEYPSGGFAYSEYVRFRELHQCLYTYQGAKRGTSRAKLLRTMEQLLLGNPHVNGHNLDDLI